MSEEPDIVDLTIEQFIEDKVARFFNDADDESFTNLYELFQNTIEKAFLRAVLRHCGGNQSQASRILGLNRTTLRARLRRFKKLDQEVIHVTDSD